MVTTRPGALLALHGAVVLFGFAGLFGKWLALSPLLIVFARTLIAAVTLWLLRRSTGVVGRWRDRWLIAAGLVLAVHWVAFFAAIQVANVAIGLLGFASFPLFVLLLERIWLGRRWSRQELATATIVALGLVLLVPGFSLADRAVQGLLWGLLSGFTFAMLAVLNRRLAADRVAVDLAFAQNFWAAVVLLPLVVLTATSAAFTPRDLVLLLVLGVLCTALSHTLFIASLRKVSAHTAAVVTALEPVYGIALAFLLLGEVPSVRTIVGGALIVGAAVQASGAKADRA